MAAMAAPVLCMALVALAAAASIDEAAVVEHTFVVSKST